MYYLDIHTHRVTQRKEVVSVQSLNLTENIFLAMPKIKPISVGLHPWFASMERIETDLRYLRVIAAQRNVKLIGECGLDKIRGENLENQIYILTQQILLAETLGKPLILHCVKAFSELIALKDTLKVNVPMIIHGFNKNEELGQQLINKGFYLSFGKNILQANSKLVNLVEMTDRFFLETDDSDLSIREVYEYVANLKKCSVDELKARIFVDWEKLIKNNG